METNIELYKIFSSVVNNKSFSKAGSELFVSQSAISQAIANLERRLKTTLFTRTVKGAMLTSEGEVLYEYVKSALVTLEAGEQKLRNMKSLEFGEVKIAAADTISRYYLLYYLDLFHKDNPKIKIEVINRTSKQSIELLKERLVDLAFVNLPIKEEGFTTIECMKLHDVFVASNRFKELYNKTINLKTLTNYPLIMLENASNSRQYINKFFSRQGLLVKPEIELGSHDLLLEFAKIGLGISCVVRELSKDYLDRNDVFEIKLDTAPKKRALGMCFNDTGSISTAAMTFKNLICNKL
ncbi:MAG: LysR family transcriptional regulator [Clostridia bacterium]